MLLETEWVLRGLYDFSPQSLAEALKALAGLGTVFLEDAGAVAKALKWFEQGLEFADALHLASAGNAKHFATFDRKLSRQARHTANVDAISL